MKNLIFLAAVFVVVFVASLACAESVDATQAEDKTGIELHGAIIGGGLFDFYQNGIAVPPRLRNAMVRAHFQFDDDWSVFAVFEFARMIPGPEDFGDEPPWV